MATDIERLIVTLEARTKEYERALLKAQGTTLTALKKIERDTAASAKRQQATWTKFGAGIETSLRRAFAGPLAALAAAFGGRELVGFADSFTRIENAVRVTGRAGDELVSTMESLFDVAVRHGAPVEALADLYRGLGIAQKDLNISSEEMIKFTDNVAASLRVSGKSASESRGALIQLSQAMGAGIVRAEEFNAILEGALPIAQAVARGLEEAGGSVAKLRRLIIDGQVSSEAFFKAFQAGSVDTQRQALLTQLTIGQAWEKIRTQLTQTVGALDDVTGASGFLATEMDKLATGLKKTGEEIEAIVEAGNSLADVFRKLTTLGPPAAEGLGLEGLRTSIEQWEKLLEQAEARGETAAAANMRARIAELEAEIVSGMNSLIGPAFERGGRDSAEAFATGFKTISLKDALANDLAGALDTVLESRKKEFSSLVGGGGGGGRRFGRGFEMPRFDSSGAAEQLQALIRQREEVDGLTADLARLETALSAHFETPFDDIMGFGAADGAREAFAQAIHDMDVLSQRFIDGQVSAQDFDSRIAGIKARLENLAGTGNEIDPFIDNMLKATSVAGQLQDQLTRTQNAINSMGGGFTSQSFSVPRSGGGGGVQDVRVIRPVAVDPAALAQGFKGGTGPMLTAIDRVNEGIATARQQFGDVKVFAEASKTTLGTILFHVEDGPSRVVGAIGQQTGALTASLSRVEAQASAANAANTSGKFGGSIGGKQVLGFDINSAKERELNALANERNVIQAGLQFKQLSPQEEQAAQLRLAAIDLHSAQLTQKMGEASDAFAQLVPTLRQMAAAGQDFGSIGLFFKYKMGNLLGTSVAGFAGGGEVHGPGGPKSDSVPIMASAGEFVVNAASTKKHRALLDAINGGSLARMADGGIVTRLNGAAQRLARGGMVQAAPAAGRGDINLNLGGVSIMAQDGRVSRESARDAGRQVASRVAYHLREMGVM